MRRSSTHEAIAIQTDIKRSLCGAVNEQEDGCHSVRQRDLCSLEEWVEAHRPGQALGANPCSCVFS